MASSLTVLFLLCLVVRRSLPSNVLWRVTCVEPVSSDVVC